MLYYVGLKLFFFLLLKKDGIYVVLPTVKGINDGPDWWFAACRCNKPVTIESGLYYCKHCGCHVFKVIPRYAIYFQIYIFVISYFMPVLLTTL